MELGIEKSASCDILGKKEGDHDKKVKSSQKESYLATKEFSKEFFSEERSKLAAEILYLRRKYRKDLPEENEKIRARKESALKKLSEIQSDYDLIDREMDKVMEMREAIGDLRREIGDISEEIDKRKESSDTGGLFSNR